MARWASAPCHCLGPPPSFLLAHPSELMLQPACRPWPVTRTLSLFPAPKAGVKAEFSCYPSALLASESEDQAALASSPSSPETSPFLAPLF